MVDELEATAGVASVAPILRSWARWSAAFAPDVRGESEPWSISAVDADFATIGTPVIERRSTRFASDAEVFVAMANGERVIVVPS